MHYVWEYEHDYYEHDYGDGDSECDEHDGDYSLMVTAIQYVLAFVMIIIEILPPTSTSPTYHHHLHY